MKNKPNIEKMIEEEVLDKFDISANDIKKQVKNKLYEHKYPNKKFHRPTSALVAAIIVIASMATAFAMSNLDILKDIFSGNTKKIQDSISENMDSIENDQFKITLEQAVSDKYSTLIIYSVEAFTDEAEEILKNDSFIFDHGLYLDIPKNSAENFNNIGIGGSTLPKYNSYRKKYFTLEIRCEGSLLEDTVLKTRMLGEDYYNVSMAIPTINKMESYDIEINKHIKSVLEYTVYKIGISNMSLVIEASQGFDDDYYTVGDYEIFFEMKDGSIKTKNQLVDRVSRRGTGDEDRFTTYYRFKKPIDFDDFKSVIVGDTAFSFDNKNITDFPINKNLKSVLFKPTVDENTGLIIFPVEDFTKTIGANYSFDAESNKLKINYRDYTFEIIVGEDTCLLNGEEISHMHGSDIQNSFEFRNGVLYCLDANFTNYFDLNISMKIVYEDFDVSDKNFYWIITP